MPDPLLRRRPYRLKRSAIGAEPFSPVGRALDQMPTPELAQLRNVIATPHIGGLTPPAIEGQSLETVRQVQAIVNREIRHGAVNAEHWRRRGQS